MKLFLIVLFGGFIVQLMAPWWILPLLALGAGALLGKHPWPAFATAFLAGGLTWLLPAGVLYFSRDHRLADQLATLFGLPQGVFLLGATFLVAGLLAGPPALTGVCLRQAVHRPRQTLPNT
ncbi:MAG: hypothetical protein NZL95_03475 [Chitinophagales bacterium]|nr:hypothetical protein [Chitinophagales bacterium]MDW8427590.1 hypothetical protein [Chitinophagales bacterium]